MKLNRNENERFMCKLKINTTFKKSLKRKNIGPDKVCRKYI